MKRLFIMVAWMAMLVAGTATGQAEFGIGDSADDLAKESFGSEMKSQEADTRAIRAVLGMSVSMTAEVRDKNEEDPYGRGIYLNVGHVWRANRAVQPIAYVGAIFTAPYDDSCWHADNSCNVSASTIFTGGKVRLMIPIPWVGPFIEAGLGVSAGRITSMAGKSDDRQDSGLLLHVPISLGLALGEDHGYTLAFSYLGYPQKNHVDGAMGIGINIPLN